MAFKVAEGSVFAVLSRSPWWYSALIGGAFVMTSLVVPSAQIAILVVACALPFFGIAGFAAFKQLKRPSAKRIQKADQEARGLSATAIAQRVAKPYVDARFDAVDFKGAAAELELERGNRKLLLSSKRFKAANTGIEPLKQLVAAGEEIEATGYLYVTLGQVSANALAFANENNIELVQGSRLVEYFDGTASID